MSKLPNIIQLQNEVDNSLKSKYKLESYLGQGNNSYIYRGVTSNNNIYLIKFIKKSNDYENDIIEIGFMRALSLFRNSSEYINTCHDFGLGNNYIIVVMNVFKGQDLGNFCDKIKDYSDAKYFDVIKQVMKHSLKALSYIHKRGVAHQNINMYSIVLSCPDYENIQYLKMVDFGRSCGYYYDVKSNKYICKKCQDVVERMNKLPPEFHKKDELVSQIQKMMKSNTKDTIELYMAKKDDIWVLGTILWVLINRSGYENPFVKSFPDKVNKYGVDYRNFQGSGELKKLHEFVINNILVPIQNRKSAKDILNKMMLFEKYGWEYQH